MDVNLLNNINLLGHNEHLIDIFTENCYLELGNIHYEVLSKLLKFEEVECKDICDFNIMNVGLGRSTINNESVGNKLPYHFFQNIHNKNKNKTIFITYGLLSYSIDNVEKFAPIVLIPVVMNMKYDKISFQLTSKPIENRVLLNQINVNNRAINNAIKLDTISSIDRYVLGFENIEGCHASFECYLTFGHTKTVNLHINHKAFSFHKDSSVDVKALKNTAENDEFYGVDILNKEQRQALMCAKNSESFAISGRLGTGKTTTLINIAIDAMLKGKKVLYVSNIDETKIEVFNKLKSYGIDSFFMDLTTPIAYLPQFFYNTTKTNEVDDIDVQSILNKFEVIQKYETTMFNRICDFRYSEILKELAVLGCMKLTYRKFDDLTVVYKHEYEQIIDSIKVIRDKVKKLNKLGIEKFNSSKFSEIPINLEPSILDFNSIIKVLSTIKELFEELVEKKILLEKRYGFSNIQSFGRLGFIITYIDELVVSNIPQSWIETTGQVFEKAKEKYIDLEKDINKLHEMQAYLQNTYRNLEEFNIDYEISRILGGIYTLNDYQKINYINQNRESINKLINRGGVDKETFINMHKKIRTILKFNLNDEIKNINEIIRFSDFICENKVDPVWIKYLDESYASRSIPKIIESRRFISEYNVLLKRYLKKYPKHLDSDAPSLLEQLKTYENNPSVRKKKEFTFIHNYRKKHDLLSLQDDISLLEEFIKFSADISLHQSRYEKLVGHKYVVGEEPVGQINRLIDYVKGIKNSEIKKRIIDYLGTIDWEKKDDEHASSHVIFNLYRSSYRSIMEIYDQVGKYVPLRKQLKMNNILNDMMNSFAYFREVFNSNDHMKNIIIPHGDEEFKEQHSEYVQVEEYLLLRNKLIELIQHEKMLIDNDEYHYLYEKYYIDIFTNCRDIKKMINFYQYYKSVFKNNDECVRSLRKNRHSDIVEIFGEIKNIFELLGLNITTYNTIFKTSQKISYYNNSFNEVIKYLDDLLNSKEELNLYLAIVHSLQIIMKYKLYKWVSYLTNSTDINNVVEEFKYSYFKDISDMYLKDNEFIDSDSLKQNMEEINAGLKQIVLNTQNSLVNKLKKVTLYRTSVKFNGSYDKYIERIGYVKKIFFTDTMVLNNYITISNFDLILIDDIQTCDSSDYGIALRGNQVIMAGIEQVQNVLSDDVISRMRKTNVLNLKKRYYPTPKHLVNEMEGANSLIKNNKNDNLGVEILRDEPHQFILDLLQENKNYRINLYCSNIAVNRLMFEKITERALELGYDEEYIFGLFERNINISDIADEYLINSDYNILLLDNFSISKYDNNITNIFDFLLQTKKKLILYDPNDLLNSPDGSSLFVSKIKALIDSSEEIYSKISQDELLYSITKIFKSRKIKVYDHHDNLDLLLEYKGKLYGVMVYYNHDIYAYQTLNDYIDNYKIYNQNNFKVYNLMLYDLSVNLTQTIEKVCEDIIHE